MPTPPAIPAPSVLSRPDLIMAARAAIDRLSGGEDTGLRIAALEGRRFDIRLPFGCAGPSDDQRVPLRWRYDEKSGTLRISATPVEWAPAEWIPGQARAEVDRIEGFWVNRPWSSSETCPPQGTGASPDPSSSEPETLGLAMIGSAGASRTGRRPGEAFALVKRVPREEIEVSRGFHLRLTGRITNAPGAGPVTCRALDGPHRHPTCLIAVALDEVAVENGSTREELATWTIARQPDAGRAPDRDTSSPTGRAVIAADPSGLLPDADALPSGAGQMGRRLFPRSRGSRSDDSFPNEGHSTADAC
jgi:hypothetical protein